MQQLNLIALDRDDVDSMKKGGMLTINGTGTTVLCYNKGGMLSTMGLPTMMGQPQPTKRSTKMLGKVYEKSPCPICRKPFAPQGMRIHAEMTHKMPLEKLLAQRTKLLTHQPTTVPRQTPIKTQPIHRPQNIKCRYCTEKRSAQGIMKHEQTHPQFVRRAG